MSKEAPKTTPVTAQTPPAQSQQARVSTGSLKTSYCNMCSTNTTREEVDTRATVDCG